MLVAAKTYALISEYALICDMRLITREYGIRLALYFLPLLVTSLNRQGLSNYKERNLEKFGLSSTKLSLLVQHRYFLHFAWNLGPRKQNGHDIACFFIKCSYHREVNLAIKLAFLYF